MESKKWCKWTSWHNRNRITDIANKLTVTQVESGERMNEEFGTSRYILLFIKQINKVLLYSPGNYSGKESEKEKGNQKPISKYSHILRYQRWGLLHMNLEAGRFNSVNNPLVALLSVPCSIYSCLFTSCISSIRHKQRREDGAGKTEVRLNRHDKRYSNIIKLCNWTS